MDKAWRSIEHWIETSCVYSKYTRVAHNTARWHADNILASLVHVDRSGATVVVQNVSHVLSTQNHERREAARLHSQYESSIE